MTDIATAGEDQAWADAYKSSWAGSPHPPVFVTADAVVIQRKCVLLIRRKGMPGRGRLALPGGYVEQNETILDAAIRELLEETGLAFDGIPYEPSAPLSWLAGVTVIDKPNRSIRGRVITHAFLFELPSSLRAPEVTAGDDAGSVAWHEVATLDPAEFFEDHFDIIKGMTS